MIPSNPSHEQSFYSGLFTEVKKPPNLMAEGKKYRLGVKELAWKWETDVQPWCYILFNSILHKEVSIAGYKDIQKENLAPGLLYSRKVNIWVSKNTKNKLLTQRNWLLMQNWLLFYSCHINLKLFNQYLTFSLAFFFIFKVVCICGAWNSAVYFPGKIK